MNTRHRLPTLTTTLLATALLALSGCSGPQTGYGSTPSNPQAHPQSYPYDPSNTGQRDYRRSPNERLYEARVTSVRAVMGSGGQRCWMEREAIPPPRAGTNIPGALAGAVIGGVLGHQIGGGSGRDLATVGGVVAGAAVGAQVGRQPQDSGPYTQDVQRCSNTGARDQVDHWDVSYEYRGVSHRAQMTSPPGATITVNADGEPRE